MRRSTMRRPTMRTRLSALPGVVLLAATIAVAWFGASPAGANTRYAGLYFDGPTADCQGDIQHFPNLYGYPYAATLTAWMTPCFATQTIVYWNWDGASSGLGGANTDVVGWSQGDPYRSDHRMCSGLYQCGGYYQLY